MEIQKPPSPVRPPIDEWIVAAVGLALVIAAAGYMLRDALIGDKTPPLIVAEVLSAKPNGNAFIVEFEARNGGGTTAAQVKIVGTLTSDGRELEQSEAVLDYVPSASSRRGGLFFRNNPFDHKLDLRAVGYANP